MSSRCLLGSEVRQIVAKIRGIRSETMGEGGSLFPIRGDDGIRLKPAGLLQNSQKQGIISHHSDVSVTKTHLLVVDY